MNNKNSTEIIVFLKVFITLNVTMLSFSPPFIIYKHPKRSILQLRLTASIDHLFLEAMNVSIFPFSSVSGHNWSMVRGLRLKGSD